MLEANVKSLQKYEYGLNTLQTFVFNSPRPKYIKMS